METITEDQFFEEFIPVKNHLESDVSFEGCMFETYGEEKDFVRNTPENKVWTIMEGEGTLYILSGMRLVNRLGFLITKKAYEVETEVIFE